MWVWRLFLYLLLILALLLLGLVATQVRGPYLSLWREQALVAFPVLGAVLLVVGSGLWRGGRRRWALLALYGLALGVVPLALEWRFEEQRARALAAPRADLERWSRHLVLGYTSFDELRTLLEQMELGGIYVTARNVRDREPAEVRLELDRLQAIQRARGRPPLLVCADQEGGEVSRLSPPLRAMPGLGEVAHAPDWRGAVRAHAARQARALRRLGINVNLAPVVDLLVPGIQRRLDTHTSLEARAIGGDPSRVAEVAQLYAETLWQGGVLATAKHFPGLGHVAEDTHHLPGHLRRSKHELQLADWVPFARLARSRYPAAVMVAHVLAERIDNKHLASTSKQLVQGVLRGELGHRGLVITDDMCMSPIYYSRGGIAARTVEALEAGVDLVLISFDPDQAYPTLLELLHRGDAVSRARLARSLQRIEVVKARLGSAPAPPQEQQEREQ